jgi:alanyl aminopeptidase
MEHPGAITYAEPILLLDPDNVTFRERRRLANVIAHEIAHMWFGNLVTMAWWDDLWLNESFAYWMAAKTVDQVYPNLRYGITTVRAAQTAMQADARATSRPIREPVNDLPNILRASNVLTNHKGHAVLAMFERWVGHELFQRGVRDYIDTHAWGNATADDLWQALSAAADQDIGPAMSTFLDQAGVPVVYVEVLEEGREKGKIRLTQQRFLHHDIESPTPDQLWHIPLVMRVASQGRVEALRVMLDEREKIVEVADRRGRPRPVDWIYPNSIELGYYRWHVDPKMLDKLAQLVDKQFIVRERVALVTHVGAMLDAAVLPGDRYLRALQRFAADPVPDVIHTVMDGLAKVENAFVTDDMEEAFALYVRQTLRPAMDRYGLRKVDGENELVTALRPTLLAWLGDTGRDTEVLDYAETLAREYVERGSLRDPALAGVALRLAAIRGDRQLFDLYRGKFESAQVPRVRLNYLTALGAFRAPALVDAALAYALAGPLRPQELWHIPRAVMAHPPHQDLTFAWFMTNYDELRQRMPPMNLPYFPYAAAGCSTDRLATAREFFAQPEHDPPGTAIELEKVAEMVTTCVALREREGAAVATYLRGLAADRE